MSEGSTHREAFVDGIAFWTPVLAGWEHAAPALRGEPTRNAVPGATPARPAPAGLAPNERRRAPDSVLVALQVAEQAVAMSGHDARELPSVFTSAHGDLPIIDALLRTLASEPQLLSPTRFHHSVHNASSGYWAMASGSHAASTALAAYDHSFGAGLLEALAQVASEERPLLLVGCDTEAVGALASVNASRGLLGVALVLSPRPGPRTLCSMQWHATPTTEAGEAGGSAATPAAEAARGLEHNAMADALPLFKGLAFLAQGRTTQVLLRCGPGLALQVRLQPWFRPRLQSG